MKTNNMVRIIAASVAEKQWCWYLEQQQRLPKFVGLLFESSLPFDLINTWTAQHLPYEVTNSKIFTSGYKKLKYFLPLRKRTTECYRRKKTGLKPVNIGFESFTARCSCRTFRTVARKSSTGWWKLHWFIDFIFRLGGLGALCGLSPPKSPWRRDWGRCICALTREVGVQQSCCYQVSGKAVIESVEVFGMKLVDQGAWAAFGTNVFLDLHRSTWTNNYNIADRHKWHGPVHHILGEMIDIPVDTWWNNMINAKNLLRPTLQKTMGHKHSFQFRLFFVTQRKERRSWVTTI